MLLPITLLSGLQGAGKSGLLANALTSEHGGGKMFAVVETLGQLEALAAHPKCKQATRSSPSRLDFPNGCMCLALAPQDLLTRVAELAKSGSYSACIIADPGTAEPIKVATALTFAPLSLTEDVENAGKQEQHEQGCQHHHGHHHHHHHDHGHQHKKACCEHGGGSCCPAPQQPAGATQAGCEKAQGKAHCHAGCCDEADEGPTLMSVCRLDTCVTVLDASTFKADLQSIEEMADRVPEGDQRNVATLLVEMVEFANVVVINKSDLVKKNDLIEVRELVAALNPCARIVETTHSSVPVQDLTCTSLFDLEKTSRSAGWLKALEELHTRPSTKQESKKGVTTYIYTARRPMHPGRLYRSFMRKYFLTRVIASDSDESGSESEEEDDSEEGSDEEMQEQQQQQQQGKAENKGKGGSKKSSEHQHHHQQQQHKQEPKGQDGSASGEEGSSEEEEDEEMQEALADYAAARDSVLKATKKELGEVVRSKGFFWLATQDESILGWDNVGALLQVMKEGSWFACVPKEEWPQEEEILKRIQADFSPEHPDVGDRRQELVFIGKNLKEDVIRKLLDSCLATEEEVKAAKEGKLRDELFGGEDEEGSDGSASEEEVSLEEAQEILNSKAAKSGKRART